MLQELKRGQYPIQMERLPGGDEIWALLWRMRTISQLEEHARRWCGDGQSPGICWDEHADQLEIEIRIKGKLGKSSDLQGWVLDTEVLKVLIRKVTFFRILVRLLGSRWRDIRSQETGQASIAVIWLREVLKWKTEKRWEKLELVNSNSKATLMV